MEPGARVQLYILMSYLEKTRLTFGDINIMWIILTINCVILTIFSMSDARARRRSSLCLLTRLFFCSVVNWTTLRLRRALSPVSECPSANATKATANRRHRHIFCILSATCEITEEVGVLSSRTHYLCTAYDFSLFVDIMFNSSAVYTHRSADDVSYSLVAASCCNSTHVHVPSGVFQRTAIWCTGVWPETLGSRDPGQTAMWGNNTSITLLHSSSNDDKLLIHLIATKTRLFLPLPAVDGFYQNVIVNCIN